MLAHPGRELQHALVELGLLVALDAQIADNWADPVVGGVPDQRLRPGRQARICNMHIPRSDQRL